MLSYYEGGFIHKNINSNGIKIYLSMKSLCTVILTMHFYADVWLSQAKNVQELGWLLHLSGQVFQLPFHGQ